MIKRMRLMYVVLLFVAQVSLGQNNVVNIKNAGADHEGVKVCTDIINNSINELSMIGGGEIYFPTGTYLSGPIELKSNITLNVSSGAVLKFTDDFDDYLPMIDSRWEGVRVKNFKSNIYAHNASNITIKGRGLIDGNGEKWWDLWWRVKGGEKTNTKWEKLFAKENKELVEKNEYINEMGYFLRPPLFMTYECNNVRVEGLTFKNPPFWTLMPAFSENITIDGITIINPDDSPNTDGIDPSSCKNVRINNCHISVGDDCIVIKSGRDEDGREAARPTENITITNCTMLDGHGGVVIGSEMSGSVRRITISNCVFQGTDRGIRIKTMRGRGGVVEDIRVSNVVMYDILKQGVMINMHYHETPEEPISERTPAIKNVFISNVRINKAKQALAIFGLKERYAENITFNDLCIDASTGIYGNYVSSVDFKSVKISVQKGEAVAFKDSDKISISGLTINSLAENTSGIKLENCSNVLINDCFQPTEISQFLLVDEEVKNVYLKDNVIPDVEILHNGIKTQVIESGNITK